jgi:hypothetical protein
MILIYEPEKKRIILNMRNYVKEILEEFERDNEDDLIKRVKTPANNNLFRIRKESEASYLSDQKMSSFILQQPKFLFFSKMWKTRYSTCSFIFDY